MRNAECGIDRRASLGEALPSGSTRVCSIPHSPFRIPHWGGAPVRVEQLRGRVVEAWHEVHVAVVDARGRLVAGAGDPGLVTFWRSAAKPFQALPLVDDGVVERFGITSAELALACASHSSEPGQVALVRDFLAKIGCTERDLLCGPHAPLCERVAEDYRTRGLRLTAVYSNCSGKHTGMLALARHHGWPTEFYARIEHPAQQRCLESVSRWTDVPREGLGVTLKVEDGHSVASALAIAAVLAELGLKPQPAALLTRPITNSRGEPVGEMRVNGGLTK